MQVSTNPTYYVRLRPLLPDARFLGADGLGIENCTCDSRDVRRGDLFVAIRGARSDGHDFAADAVARGCCGIVAQRALGELAVPQVIVPNSQDAYARICQALAGNPSEQLKVVGITGTNGKTTTSCLLAGILTAADQKVGLVGTLGYLDGREIAESTHTTPPPKQLAALLARMVRNGCSHAVMEVSSHALDQSRVAGVRFDAACLTNITRDHLDYHSTLRDYRAAKSKLFGHLAPEGFAVVNADDPVSAGILPQIDGPVLTVGIRSAAEITATPVEQHAGEQTFLLTAGSDTMPVSTKMIGEHHIYNCLEAAAVGLVYGIDLPTVVRGLESVVYVPGRLERVECGQPFAVFVDYAHTPDALTGSLRALRQVTAGRVICVFGAGGDRDRQKRPLMGQAVDRNADHAILTNDNPRTEDPVEIVGDLLEGFADPDRPEVVLDRVEAIHAALSAAEPGDCVLIAGKGHENHQIIGQTRIPLDDRQIAREWLYRVRPFAEIGG